MQHNPHRTKSLSNARWNEAKEARQRRRGWLGLMFLVAALALLGRAWWTRAGKQSSDATLVAAPVIESVLDRKDVGLPELQGVSELAAQQPVAGDRGPAEKPTSKPDPIGLSSDEILAKAVENDPVAQKVPLLAGRSPQQQLEALKWMASIPDSKFAMAFKDLQTVDMPMEEKIYEALAMTEDMIADLERRGYRFELANDFRRIPEDSVGNGQSDTRVDDLGVARDDG
jgi:hypothetical protein